MRLYAQIDLFAVLAEARRKRLEQPPLPDAPPPEDADEEAIPDVLAIPLLPEGTFAHPWYGDLEWTQEKLLQAVANFEAEVTGYCPMLNFDHSTYNPFAGQARAAGWFKRLFYAPGAGLFGDVDLNNCAKEAIAEREYRYISAEFADEYENSKGDVFAHVLCGAALTNTPFHDTMSGLFSGRDAGGQTARCFSTVGPLSVWAARATPGGDPPQPGGRIGMDLKKLVADWRAKLRLSAETSDEEVLTAATAKLSASQDPPGNDGAPADDTQQHSQPPATTVTLTADHLATLQASAAKVTALEEQVTNLTKSANDANQKLLEKSAKDSVAKYEAQGKITPAIRESALKFALADPVLFEEIYEKAPVVLDMKRHGLPPDLNSGAGGAESFTAAVSQYLTEHPGVDYLVASREVCKARPDLYNAHRRAVTGRDN